MQDKARYPLPVYLNQKYCFDLLAMMEDGLAQLETVRTTENEQGERSTRFSGDVGLRDVFAFVGVKFGGERVSSSQTGTSREALVEKVHTPNSLFARVRKRLYDEELVTWAELSQTEPGNFIEFNATLRKNPLVDALEGIKSLGELALLFQDGLQQEQGATRPSNQRRNRSQGTRSTVQPSRSDDVLGTLSTLLEQLSTQGSLDLIGRSVGDEALQVVITLDRAFLSDLSLSELVDGEYTVLGKVVRAIPVGSTETINLLRKTSLGRVQSKQLEQVAAGFQDAQAHGVQLPEIITSVGAPAIQIIPLAIFA